LVGDFDDESRPHTHVYTVEWSLSSADLDENGFSVDISLLESTLEAILDRVSGKLLNDFPFFQDKQTSVEYFAVFLYEQVAEKLEQSGFDTGRVEDSELRIWESDSAWASYRPASANL
jgi:6-pyruvoyl-tetrahydropterin synthase